MQNAEFFILFVYRIKFGKSPKNIPFLEFTDRTIFCILFVMLNMTNQNRKQNVGNQTVVSGRQWKEKIMAEISSHTDWGKRLLERQESLGMSRQELAEKAVSFLIAEVVLLFLLRC